MDYTSILQAQGQAPFPGMEAAPMAPGTGQAYPGTSPPQFSPPYTPPGGEQQPLPQSSPAQAVSPPPAEEQQSPGFMEKLRTNPALAQAALMMGARMMMGPKPGQDALGVLGESMMIGNHTFTMGKQNEIENEQTAQRAEGESRRNAAQTARTEQQTAQDAEMFPQLKEKVQADIVRLRAAGKADEAKALALEYQNAPERLAEMYGLKVQEAKADISARQGSAASGFASANASNARAAMTRDEMKDPGKYKGASSPSAALTRSTFLPQLLADTTKELDIVTDELAMASSKDRKGLQDRQTALLEEKNRYKKEMAKMSNMGEAAPAGSMSTPAGRTSVSLTMPAAPGTKPAAKPALTMTEAEVMAQAKAKGKTYEEALKRAEALGVTVVPNSVE